MKKFLLTALLLCAALAVNGQDFVRGADLSWATANPTTSRRFSRF